MQHNRDGDQNLFNLLGRFSLLLVVCLLPLSAGESFKNFKRAQVQSFQAFKDERDAEFSNYLMREWKSFSAQKPATLYTKPKPLHVESALPSGDKKAVGPKVSIKVQKPLDAKDDSKDITKEKKQDIVFDFYGSKLGFNIAPGIKGANFYPSNQKGIVNFFNVLASSEYELLISDVKKTAKDMNLNDWGIYLLVMKVSDSIFTNQDNSKLFSWFVFNKLGYAVKIGLAKKHVVLMHYSSKTIYSTPRYDFGGKDYYAVADYAKGSYDIVFSYKEDYPNSTKALDLSLETLPKLEQNIERKVLSFSNSKNIYKIPVVYNKNLLDFMSSYPQAEYEVFFNAPLDDITYNSLATSIKEYIDGKKASEAIDFILAFVQKSLKYEQDMKQFSREKVMFAQEALFYDKSDCEDRAVLFSYLINRLFSINVVGVKYEDHMATALNIPIKGDSVTTGNKKFVIADPTYVNATVGMSMPKYKFIKPKSYILIKRY